MATVSAITHAVYLLLVAAAFAIGVLLGSWATRDFPAAKQPVRFALWGAVADVAVWARINWLCDYAGRKARFAVLPLRFEAEPSDYESNLSGERELHIYCPPGSELTIDNTLAPGPYVITEGGES